MGNLPLHKEEAAAVRSLDQIRRVTGASAARRLARRGAKGVAPDLTRGPTLAARQTHSWLECSENETPGECSNTWLQEARDK